MLVGYVQEFVAVATAAAAAEGGVALLEDGARDGGLHTRAWWDRHYGGKGNAETGTTLRAFALQVAAGLVVVVWLTALIVGAVLKRSDGRSEEHRALLV